MVLSVTSVAGGGAVAAAVVVAAAGIEMLLIIFVIAVFRLLRYPRTYRFLWGTYRPAVYYYEVWECVRKLFLTGLLVYFAEGSSTQVGQKAFV